MNHYDSGGLLVILVVCDCVSTMEATMETFHSVEEAPLWHLNVSFGIKGKHINVSTSAKGLNII